MRLSMIWPALLAAGCMHRAGARFAPLPAPVASAPITASPCESVPPPSFDTPPSFETPKPFEPSSSFPAPPAPVVAEPPQYETPAAFPTPPAPSPCD